MLHLKVLGQDLFQVSPLASGRSSACGSITPVCTQSSLCVCVFFVQKFSFLKGQQSYWIRAHPNELIFNLITSVKTLSPTKVTF